MKKGEISLTGFVFSLLALGLGITSFVLLSASIEDTYNVSGEASLSKFNRTQTLVSTVEGIKENATNIQQQTGFLDVIGGFFTQGYAAIKLTFTSFDVWDEMMVDAQNDMPIFGGFPLFTYLKIMILALILIGVIIAILVKWKV